MKPVRVEYVTPQIDQAPPATMPLARRSPSFVEPDRPRQPPAVIDVPSWAVQSPPVDVAPAWAAIDGTRENTSAMDRAQALRVRLVPFLLTWGLVSLVVGLVVWMVAKQWPAGALLALLLFASLTAYSYYRLNRTDYEYSREGTEQLKVATAADLARLQIEQAHELRRAALAAYLRTLERHERK